MRSHSAVRVLYAVLVVALTLLPATEFPAVVAEDAAAVARLFAANDPASVAWAAYHAARLRLATAIPDLVAHLGNGAGKGYREPEQVAARACAAALADLRQPVEAGVPARVWSTGCRAEAYYLAAIEPARHEAWLIERLQSSDEGDTPWQAAANLLAKRRTPEATLAIFRGLAPTLTIAVWNEGRTGGHRRSMARCGDGVSTRLPGFPPLVAWELTSRDEKGVELLADGPTQIWVSRREQTQESDGVGSVSSPVRRAQYRTQVLQSLLGTGATSPALEHDQEVSVGWPGRQALLEHATRTLAEQQGGWTALTTILLEARLLPAGTLPPALRLVFTDKRTGDALEALPDPAAVSSPAPVPR